MSTPPHIHLVLSAHTFVYVVLDPSLFALRMKKAWCFCPRGDAPRPVMERRC